MFRKLVLRRYLEFFVRSKCSDKMRFNYILMYQYFFCTLLHMRAVRARDLDFFVRLKITGRKQLIVWPVYGCLLTFSVLFMWLMGPGPKLCRATFQGSHLSKKLCYFEFFVRFFGTKTLQAGTQRPDALRSLPGASPATQHHFRMSLNRKGEKMEVGDPDNASQPAFFR